MPLANASTNVQDAAALQHATDLQGDSSIVRLAVQGSGEALRFASAELRAERKMVALAVANNGAALQYVMEDVLVRYCLSHTTNTTLPPPRPSVKHLVM